MNKKILFADFETITFDSDYFKKYKHTNVFMWYLKDIDNTMDKIGDTIDNFMNFLYEQKENLIVYFHNLSFDGDFIYKYLLRNRRKDFLNTLEKKEAKQDRNWFMIFNNGNSIYSIEINTVSSYIDENGKRKKKRQRIKFMCTYKLLSSSINSLGKSLGLNKLNEIEKLINQGIIKDKNDFYNQGGFNMKPVIKEAFEKYIKQDVEIARLAYINFSNNLFSLKNLVYSKKFKKNCVNLENKLTIGGIVYALSKNYIYNNFGASVLKKYKIKEKDYDLAHKFFNGGWTQFNPKYFNKYLVKLNGVVIDINSSYPYQMTKLLPVGKLYNTISKKWKYHLVFYEVKLSWIRIKKEYEDFVILKNKKKDSDLRYEKEMIDTTLYYYEEEFEFIKKIYDMEILNVKTYFCEAEYLFKGLIEELYQYKEYYANKGEEANKLTYKIMLNSLFGRQCMRKAYDVEIWVNDKDFESFKKLREMEMGIIINGKRYAISKFRNKKQPITKLNGVCLLEVKKDNAKYTNVLIGAMITSYARLQLWETILKFGVDKYMYCDTDSIFLNTNEDISKKIELDKSKLGAWSIDTRFKEGKILGAKRYAMVKEDNKGIKFGFSGVNNIDFDEIDIDEMLNDDTELIDAQSILERDDYGIIIKRRNFKIKKGKL